MTVLGILKSLWECCYIFLENGYQRFIASNEVGLSFIFLPFIPNVTIIYCFLWYL